MIDLATIAQAVSDKLNEHSHYESFEGGLWDDGDDSEYRHYFVTGTRTSKCWISITDEGVKLQAMIRDDKSWTGAHDDQGRTAGSLRNAYRNAFQMAKRAAARAAREGE